MPTPLGRHLGIRGWSDGVLARRAGLHRAHVNEIKNGRVRPTVATALAIARALGLEVERVFPVAPAISPAAAPRRTPGRAAAPAPSPRAAISCD